MTDDEIAAIEARANAATPGPWRRSYVMHSWIVSPGDREDDANRCVAIPQRTRSDDPRFQANLHFIAHARRDVPALVAALREARADVAVAEEQRDYARQDRQEAQTVVADLKAQLVDAHIDHGVTRKSLEQTDAEVARLREALAVMAEDVGCEEPAGDGHAPCGCCRFAKRRASAALEAKR